MSSSDILQRRLHNQHITEQIYRDPADIVSHLGAVQAQDYAGAKWALGMRLLDATDPTIEKAFTEGSILRTHVMRPTWHFVTPADIRWLLTLTAPRVHAASAYYYRQSGLDDALFARSNNIIAGALRGGNYLTRTELAAILERSGIPAAGISLNYIMMCAELDAVICSGPRHGNQFTYALLEERALNAGELEHDKALAELTRRYFSSHGPATVKDFAWWSGLTAGDVKAGLEMSKSHLTSEKINGETYWLSQHQANLAPATDKLPAAYLLSTYDEYVISYKDRKELTDPAHTRQATAGRLPIIPFQSQIAIEGKVLGAWKRTLKKNEVLIETYFFRPLTTPETQALSAEVTRYSRFLGLPATLQSRVI